jgi:hypothetical protein
MASKSNAAAIALFSDPRFALPADQHILTERQAAAFLNVSTRTLQGWRVADPPCGPPWVRVGPGSGRLGYFRSDLIAHTNARKFSSAAAEAAFHAVEGV